MVDGMAEVSKRLLLNYEKINNHFPSVVVVMRDGVADNQIQEMIDIEVQGIRQVGCLRH